MASEALPLKTESGRLFRLSKDVLEQLVEELENFLIDEEFMNTKEFSKKVMFTHEIKANNTVEGYNDSVSIIQKIIEDAKSEADAGRRNRIINLYHGYQYILKGKDINEENVLELYEILSKGLLGTYDVKHMGEKYRQAPVYILRGGRLDDSMDHGVPFESIPEYMDSYFEFINKYNIDNVATDYFIKSQIMHFYFVYIHPFFDINGRSSRTIAMWYLLNNQAYPYIIFNRGINFDSNYDRIIHECKNHYDITKFLKYMLINVKKELEKEYIMHYLDQQSTRAWHTIDYQTINYFLSLNGGKTILDYVTLYNRMNSKRSNKVVYESMLLPMIEDGTLVIERESKKCMWDDQHNLVLSLNQKRMKEINLEKVTRLSL